MPGGMSTRPARVGSAFAWEVAKHTTDRDREIAWFLYRQKILTTDQLRLLFFGSLRRCQDRLLWLYRHRVIDRFYLAGPFSLGKPQAHWLLDESAHTSSPRDSDVTGVALAGIASRTSTSTPSSLTVWSTTGSSVA
jgi:Replication-relaxation